ncbi:hypothetical protein [Micromonospora sp. WMMD1082]|uniref:hypothetical protein n=1 Tax=Micromonospora sp. WMMD1082 TaxID=3016104 RepID=UPI0024161D54|nr:hypothetical protein [Micromonospora sp. WMMD1082]MDG4793612.1 hypothetical protein [Micromonospora sp. WMMD1082]
MTRPRQRDDLNQNTLLLLRAAIGLAAVHFPLKANAGTVLVSSRDVAFLLDGHVDVWPAWPGLAEEDTHRIVRLLRLRRSEYADGEWVRRALRQALEEEGLPGCQLVNDADDGLTIACAPGMPPRDFVDEALGKLARRSSVGRGHTAVAGPGRYHTTMRVTTATGVTQAVDQRYLIPVYPTPKEQAAPELRTSAHVGDIMIPVNDLIELAGKIDATRGGGAYRARHVRKLCKRLRTADGFVSINGLLGLPAGKMRLLNAPTGFGKSVLMEVIACWIAANPNGLVMTLVVPTNSDVLKLTRAIELDLDALGLDASATALMSPSAVFKTAQKVIQTRPSWDPDGQWTTDRLGYGCALAASAETEAAVDGWSPGSEPCVTLQATGDDNAKQRACPWRTTCGKSSLARAAMKASVIVTSHANFHSGRLHLPVQDEHGLTDRTTVEELVFRRSHLVVIDEIDAFQSNVISQAARGLVLDRRGSTRTPLHELESEYVRAAGRINREVESSVRDMVHHSKFLASLYTAALYFGTIGVEGLGTVTGRYWIVPRRWDGALTAQLYGLAEHEPLTPAMVSGFRSLFPGEEPSQPDEPLEFPAIRQILATVTEVGSGAKHLEDSRDRLDALLESRITDVSARTRAINRLLQRAILERLRQHLRQFVYDAPHLAAAGVPAAREIAETFGPYSRWRPLPTGPLGRLLFAFSHHVDPSGRLPIRLNAAAFGGDPHVYTTTLGDVTALCRAGTRRAVLGLSATAFFPQAPHHHVHVDPYWWVSDEDPGGVKILPAYVADQVAEQRRLVRVSGTEGARRDEALRRLAELLWRTRLQQELQRLSVEDPNRQLVLLATTSYDGGRAVAEGLVRAGVDPRRICLAVRPETAPDIGDTSDDEQDRTSWRELAADRLEEVPGLDVDILIAPLARVQRGVNIIGADDRSALGSIWLLVRPVPIIDEPAELIAHVNAYPLAPDANDDVLSTLRRRPADVLDARKQAAGHYFEEIVTSLPYFRTMPKAVQLSITAEIMNGIVQLVGRARRGGTPAAIYLADGALLDPGGGPTFGTLIRKLRDHWDQTGQLSRMRELYGTTLAEFFRYADDEAKLLA